MHQNNLNMYCSRDWELVSLHVVWIVKRCIVTVWIAATIMPAWSFRMTGRDRHPDTLDTAVGFKKSFIMYELKTTPCCFLWSIYLLTVLLPCWTLDFQSSRWTCGQTWKEIQSWKHPQVKHSEPWIFIASLTNWHQLILLNIHTYSMYSIVQSENTYKMQKNINNIK